MFDYQPLRLLPPKIGFYVSFLRSQKSEFTLNLKRISLVENQNRSSTIGFMLMLQDFIRCQFKNSSSLYVDSSSDIAFSQETLKTRKAQIARKFQEDQRLKRGHKFG